LIWLELRSCPAANGAQHSPSTFDPCRFRA